ncbi:uncharacterized protein [Montipora foliosa]|uniref:uncharacterized protein n=1 Tax=Montipora foliosa TaxID=591990 RepID=UPI0035F1BE91
MSTSKKRFWRVINAFFDTHLSEIDLDNVDTWQVKRIARLKLLIIGENNGPPELVAALGGTTLADFLCGKQRQIRSQRTLGGTCCRSLAETSSTQKLTLARDIGR